MTRDASSPRMKRGHSWALMIMRLAAAVVPYLTVPAWPSSAGLLTTRAKVPGHLYVEVSAL